MAAMNDRIASLKLLLTLIGMMLLLVGCDRGAATVDEDAQTVDASMCDPNDGGIELPEGFCASVVVDSLGRLRHIAVRENGDIYVIHRNASDQGGMSALRDTTGDGKADVIETFGEVAGTGMELYNGYLYASTDTSVHRYRLTDDQLVPTGEPETIVSGFPRQGSHASKPVAFDESGNMYVTVGGPSNACQEQARTAGSPGQDPCPQLERQGGVWRFDAETTGQTQEADGHRFATGIRNAVAIAWDPTSDHIYAVQHGRDQLHGLWEDMYTDEESADLPAEEFLRLTDGADFGWPYCYYDHLKQKKVLAPEYGGDGEETGRCAEAEDPIAAFPGHFAPNDLVFYTASQFPSHYRNGAFIAFHGSWNRAPLPQEGYRVAFLPLSDGSPSGDWETFADGFKGTEELQSPGDAVYRPTGLGLGPDGSLYIVDSQKGRIWRVLYTGEPQNVGS